MITTLSAQQDEIVSKILTSGDALTALSSEWHDLFTGCSSATPFQHPAWLRAWIESFSPSRLAVIELRSAGKLAGLAPLLIYPRGEERVLAFAGGGVSDYLGWLFSSNNELTDALLRAMLAIPNWTVLDLTDLRSGSAVLNSRIGEFARVHDTCFVLDLPKSKDELLHVFSKRQRANLRNAESRLRRIGEGRVELAAGETLSEALDDLFRLHASRWERAGQSGVLHEPEVQQFHRRAAPALLDEGILLLYRLRLGQRTIAVVYSMFLRETVYCYMQGYEPELASVSPGTQLMFHVLADAVNRGMRRFDFLRGEESYKQHWRPHGENTYRIQLPRAELAAIVERSWRAA